MVWVIKNFGDLGIRASGMDSEICQELCRAKEAMERLPLSKGDPDPVDLLVKQRQTQRFLEYDVVQRCRLSARSRFRRLRIAASRFARVSDALSSQ